MTIPVDNPMTVEGIALGRFLFYEERLSGNNMQSCGSCHSQARPSVMLRTSQHRNRWSTGNRSSMALMNLGWGTSFFWDGRSATLEQQILEPVINP